MKTSAHYDCVVIGSGQAGGPLSQALAKSGFHTALIERAHIGGTCINEGCTPTKTMVASARVAYPARRAADYGVQGCSPTMDMNRVRQRKRDIVTSFRSGSQKRIEQTKNLDLIFGEASFTGPKSLQVRLQDGGQQAITTDRLFLNTGTRASLPSTQGIEGVRYLDNASIMELDVVPEHLVVLGGGYIGVEFGQMFRRFGSRVTIIQSGTQLLAREDGDVADEVAKILREDGIELLFGTKAQRVRQIDGMIDIDVRCEDQDKSISGSHLLVATGRVPNTEDLNLPAAGVAKDKHALITV